MLTVVGAIATQTLASSASPERFTEAFLGRVNSLAQSYSLVSREHWGEVSLRDIIRTEVQPYLAGDGQRARLDGPDLRFDPSQALGFGLVFHELVTNAAKYGALSTLTGRLQVTWTRERGQIVLLWVEEGGPAVQAPSHRGFGMTLVERQLSTGFHARATFDYAPDGLRIRIVIPYEPVSLAASN